MRITGGVLCLLMVLFAAVQYNDPDFYIWAPIYLVPAGWAGLTAWRPDVIARPPIAVALYACLGLAVAGTIVAWPTDDGWWRQDVWWESEKAREGMGMMIVTVVLAVVTIAARRARRADDGEARPA